MKKLREVVARKRKNESPQRPSELHSILSLICLPFVDSFWVGFIADYVCCSNETKATKPRNTKQGNKGAPTTPDTSSRYCLWSVCRLLSEFHCWCVEKRATEGHIAGFSMYNNSVVNLWARITFLMWLSFGWKSCVFMCCLYRFNVVDAHVQLCLLQWWKEGNEGEKNGRQRETTTPVRQKNIFNGPRQRGLLLDCSKWLAKVPRYAIYLTRHWMTEVHERGKRVHVSPVSMTGILKHTPLVQSGKKYFDTIVQVVSHTCIKYKDLL